MAGKTLIFIICGLMCHFSYAGDQEFIRCGIWLGRADHASWDRVENIIATFEGDPYAQGLEPILTELVTAINRQLHWQIQALEQKAVAKNIAERIARRGGQTKVAGTFSNPEDLLTIERLEGLKARAIRLLEFATVSRAHDQKRDTVQ